MGDVVIAMPKREDAKRIADIIRKYGAAEDIILCTSGAATLRECTIRDSGAVICTVRMPDMDYAELAEYLPSTFGIIVLTKNAELELHSDNMRRLILPLKVRELLDELAVFQAKYQPPKRKKQQIPARRDPEQQKIIDQAKQILMERDGKTEPEAFRYIQKQSMDSGRTMLESAQMVLLLYGDWNK